MTMLTDREASVLYHTYFFGATDEFGLASECGDIGHREEDHWLAAILVCEQAGWVARQPNPFAADLPDVPWPQIEWAMTDTGERFWKWYAPRLDPAWSNL